MAKKGGPTALQQEVNTNEEWAALLEKEGLIVVDIYSEWCGPCLGMVGNLKKLKLEIGDNLVLAVAKADNIDILERFRNKCEPTWMFVAFGKLVRIIFGAHAPRLMRAIEQELKIQVKAMAGEVERRLYNFNELTEEELKRKEEIHKRKEHEKEKADAEMAQQLDQIKRRTLERIARELNRYDLVIFFPHIIVEPDEKVKKRTCQAAYKLMVMYDSIGLTPIDQLDKQLRKEDLHELFYSTDFLDHLPKSFIKMICKRPCMVTLLIAPERGKDNVETQPLGFIEEKLATICYGHMDPYNPAPDTVARNFMQENEEGAVIPPLWTPLTFLSKATAMKILFPQFVSDLRVVEDSLPPPSYVMIFEANKAHEVLEAAEPFVDDILHIGYFDSADPEVANKVAKTVYQLEKMGQIKMQETKMVIALQKTRSDPMLALAQFGPIYISNDLVVGTKEADMFFPPKVEIEPEPDHWAPPPESEMMEEGVYIDLYGNQYTEEYWEDDVTGEPILVKRLHRYPDGSSVHGFYQLTDEGEYIFRRPSDSQLKEAMGEEEDHHGLEGEAMMKLNFEDEEPEEEGIKDEEDAAASATHDPPSEQPPTTA